ncbi:uncharacterized protein LOC133727202 [Rosa rugosa]|uniref:uncharacterized protein LOC133727202 n=1 Tax=Rosa rugosa TaxID=74645 RepID=UPI002B40DBD9|nr:uncharacterized protein LOC133727202 [Rosa rugosa]
MAMNTNRDDGKNPKKMSKKGKSCKGTLYYSSALQSKAKNPRCIGIPRTLPQVPNSIVEESKADASKDERHLKDFYYACAGYSVFLDQIGKESSGDKRTAKELPVCVGLEFLVGKKAHTSAPAVAPTAAHALNKDDARVVRQPQRPKPIQSAGSDFLTRFSRNADLVASGVWKNMGKVGNYMKESVSDILYPYRGRPK